MPHCALCTRPHCFRTPCRESGGPFIPPKGEETRVGGVGIPRPGLMEIEGRTECFSS